MFAQDFLHNYDEKLLFLHVFLIMVEGILSDLLFVLKIISRNKIVMSIQLMGCMLQVSLN